MRILAIGGHTRNIGKTALVVDLIRALPEARWTAVKITQFGHGVCSIDGKRCDCSPGEHPFVLEEEQNRDDRTDTSRFLVAGAERSLWLRVRQGSLRDALPALREQLRKAGNVIVESNTLVGVLAPDMYLMVLDPSKTDFKDSARKFLSRADALILRSPFQDAPWPQLRHQMGNSKPRFLQTLGRPIPEPVVDLVRNRFLITTI